MQSIPYELLQQISSCLLPRYQCRLALASKWCYRYLYNDLLKWHAKWHLVAPPRYKCSRDMSLMEFNKQLILYKHRYYYGLFVYNLTNLYGIVPDVNRKQGHIVNKSHTIDTREIMQICWYLENTNLLTGCYKYIHKTFLIIYLNSKHPLLSMPTEIIICISEMLSRADWISFITSNAYLNYNYSWV